MRRPVSGTPGGLHVHGGELLSGSSTRRPTLGIGGAQPPRLGDVAVTASLTLPDGTTTLAIDRINKARRSGDLVLYSRRWGTATRTLANGTEVVLTGAALPLRVSGTWTATVAAVRPAGGNSAIATGSLVLSAQGTDATALAALAIGSTVTIRTSITSGWEDVAEAVGGREWAVEDGQPSIRPVSAFTASPNPRTAVGIGADGHLVLAAIDGRRPGYSVGVTAADLADLLVSQGVSDAIILDGGGSTTALVRRPGDVEATVVNRPSDGSERGVANALLVVSSIRTGPLAGIIVRPAAATAVVGQTIALQTRGVDAALNGVSTTAIPVAWAMTGSGGSLGATGGFRAREPGAATVTATAGGVAGTAALTVVPDTYPPTASAPVVRLRRGATVNPGVVPVTVSWTAATDVGTGVVRYELRRRLDGGDWQASRCLPRRAAASRRRCPRRARCSTGCGPRTRRQRRRMEVLRSRSPAPGLRALVGHQVRADVEDEPERRVSGRGREAVPRPGATASYSFTGSQVAWIAARGPRGARPASTSTADTSPP